MKNNRQTICRRCVMDTTDSNIKFDENGECDYCQNFDKNIKNKLLTLRDSNQLATIVKK